MGHDLRKMMKELKNKPMLSPGHADRFEAKLERAFHSEKLNLEQKDNTTFFWMKIAATVIVFLGVGYFGYQQLFNNASNSIVDTTLETTRGDNTTEIAQITLGDLSPDLKRVEDFYLAGINSQLASIEPNEENKELIDGYMNRLSELDLEYKLLNIELNEVGPTEATINALIDNLKLRLELLFKLKNKLKELKNLENEKFNDLEA